MRSPHRRSVAKEPGARHYVSAFQSIARRQQKPGRAGNNGGEPRANRCFCSREFAWPGCCCSTYPLGPYLESVEASVGNQDRGRGHIRTERQIPQTTRGVGTCNLGDCVAEPVGGQSACRFPAADGNCPNCLSPLWPVLAGFGSDPTVPGTSGGRASGTAANVFRATSSR